jgi:hypothetical protein
MIVVVAGGAIAGSLGGTIGIVVVRIVVGRCAEHLGGRCRIESKSKDSKNLFEAQINP